MAGETKGGISDLVHKFISLFRLIWAFLGDISLQFTAPERVSSIAPILDNGIRRGPSLAFLSPCLPPKEMNGTNEQNLAGFLAWSVLLDQGKEIYNTRERRNGRKKCESSIPTTHGFLCAY